jgi:hypothetical protein
MMVLIGSAIAALFVTFTTKLAMRVANAIETLHKIEESVDRMYASVGVELI